MNPATVPAPAGVRVVRLAPAKLNLTLAVVGRREDGFHALHSVMVPLALGDAVALSVVPGEARGGARGATRGDTLRVAGLPLAATHGNLVLRALTAARTAVEASGAAPAGTLPPSRRG